MGFASFQQMLLWLQFCPCIFQQGLRMRLEVQWINKDFRGLSRNSQGNLDNMEIRKNHELPQSKYTTTWNYVWNSRSHMKQNFTIRLCVCLVRCIYNFLRTARSADFGYVTCERWTPLKCWYGAFVEKYSWKVLYNASSITPMYLVFLLVYFVLEGKIGHVISTIMKLHLQKCRTSVCTIL